MATFRLFVHHGRSLSSPKEEQELRQLFEKFGQVTAFFTKREWKNSQISFSTTAEAKRAKEELDKTRFNKDMTLKIFFSNPSRRVLVRGLPASVSFKDLQEEFEGATHVEKESNDVAVTFETISDAQAVVKAGKVYQGRTLSFDFVNEVRGANQKERRASDSGRRNDGQTRGRSRSPPRVRQVVRLSRSPSRRRSRSPPQQGCEPE